MRVTGLSRDKFTMEKKHRYVKEKKKPPIICNVVNYEDVSIPRRESQSGFFSRHQHDSTKKMSSFALFLERSMLTSQISREGESNREILRQDFSWFVGLGILLRIALSGF